jgi:dihydrofolate synthase/folylpolyglutamate synthase
MTDYAKTINELFDLQRFSIKMGLENIRAICEFLQNPQDKFPVIHIAGTNGKGSTSRIIQAILSAHRLKTGLYTSPHLVDFRERITIDGRLIEKKFIVSYWKQMAPLIRELKATFFDTTTALAFDYFYKKKVDIAVIETGLGGRLDSTNIVKPVAVALTPISIDHVHQLGRNLKDIASEKAAIIKPGVTVFLSRQDKKAMGVFEEHARQARGCHQLTREIKINHIKTTPTQTIFDLFDRQRDINLDDLRINLAGAFQSDNACLAYLTARWYLEHAQVIFSEEKMREILAHITWPGRLQRFAVSPDIYLDVSHNYGGFKHSLSFIQNIGTIDSRYLLIGLLNDKAYKEIIRLLQKTFKHIILTEPAHDRALPLSVLEKEFHRYGRKTVSVGSIEKAFRYAVRKLGKTEQLFVMGSHYIIGEILRGSGKNT